MHTWFLGRCHSEIYCFGFLPNAVTGTCSEVFGHHGFLRFFQTSSKKCFFLRETGVPPPKMEERSQAWGQQACQWTWPLSCVMWPHVREPGQLAHWWGGYKEARPHPTKFLEELEVSQPMFPSWNPVHVFLKPRKYTPLVPAFDGSYRKDRLIWTRGAQS